MNSAMIISIVSLSLCVSGFLLLRRYIARKTDPRTLLADYRDEVFRLIAEIDAATDRDSLLVEERIKTLRKLMEDTDRRISVYMREVKRSQDSQAMYTSLGRGVRAALAPAPPQETTAVQETLFPEPSPAAPAPSAQAPKKKRAPRKSKTPEKPKVKAKIAELAALGHPPAEIASRLGLSLAEVDLALNLLHASARE